MPPLAAALPIAAGAASIYSAIKGSQQQGQANQQNQQQLQQLQQQQQAQNQIRNQVLANLSQQPSGAVGNPFSGSYGPVVNQSLGSGPLNAPQPLPQQGAQALQAIPQLAKPGMLEAMKNPQNYQAVLRGQYGAIR